MYEDLLNSNLGKLVVKHQTRGNTLLTSSGERSDKESLLRLVFSLGTLRSPTPWFPEVIRTAAGSLGGGGNGDLIFPAPGGGARPTVFGFPVPESPAADSIPVPLVGLGFTFIRIVSPSYNLQNPNKSKSNSKKKKTKTKTDFSPIPSVCD